MQHPSQEHLPPVYGTVDNEVPGHTIHQQSVQAPEHHSALAAGSHESAAPSAPTWQHYPEPPALAQHAPASNISSNYVSRYPSVPVPAPDFNVSLASPQGSMAGGSASPTAAAVGAAALAFAASGGVPGSPVRVGNQELRILVHDPLKHMGPSGIPGLEEAYISYEVTTLTSMPHFSANRITVRRRFRDFVSLANLLPKLLHGR